MSENDHLIVVKNLQKEFYILRKKPGITGALLSLFSRTYNRVDAIHDVSFNIKKGELVGYVGPNGAGKSTTIKIISGILYPTSGDVVVDGLSPFKQRKKFASKLGVMFGQRTQLWWDLPLTESYDLLRTIYKVPANVYKENLDYFHETLKIGDFWSQPVRRLSLGQRVRADLAAALLHNPQVLLLDEPTIGLDVLARAHFRDLIKKINRDKKTTILITSHDLGDIESIVNRLILIDKGTIMYDGTLHSFMKKYAGHSKISVSYKGNPVVKNLPPGAVVVKNEGRLLELDIDTGKISYQKLLQVIPVWGEVADIHMQSTSLEKILSEMYGR